MRNDLVEKVNGQLHSKRIETTRVISSDIEELRIEVRRSRCRKHQGRLDGAGGGGGGGGTAFPPATVVESRIRNSAPLALRICQTRGTDGRGAVRRTADSAVPNPPSPPLVTPGQPTTAQRRSAGGRHARAVASRAGAQPWIEDPAE